MSDETSKQQDSIADEILAARLAELDHSSSDTEATAIDSGREAAATPFRRIERQRWSPGRKSSVRPSVEFVARQTAAPAAINPRISAAKVDLNCLFEKGSRPPDWALNALSVQAGRLGVEIQHAVPKRSVDEIGVTAKIQQRPDELSHLTPKTEDSLFAETKKVEKAAIIIRSFVTGAMRSNKSKAKQADMLESRIGTLRRLVRHDTKDGEIVPPDGVLLNYLFASEMLVSLQLDDDIFADCLSLIEQHLPPTAHENLARALAPTMAVFLNCLASLEELAHKRIKSRIKSTKGRRPKESSVTPQLRCAVIIAVLKERLPGFCLSWIEWAYKCERLWQAVGGKPHTINDSGVCDVWRLGWRKKALEEDTEIRRDVESSFPLRTEIATSEIAG